MHGRSSFAIPLTADLPVLFPTPAAAAAAGGVTSRQVADFDTNPHPATGGGHRAAPNGSEGAGNRAGSPEADEWPALGLLITLALWAMVALGIMIILGGCTPAQETTAGTSLTNAASEGKNLSAMLVGSPTTQPSPGVTLVEAVAPVTTPYITAAGTAVAIVSAGLGALGTYLTNKGTIASLATSVVDHKSAIAEVVSDVKNWRDPTVSFTAKTEKIVADAAGIVAAAPASALTDTTLTPATLMEAKPLTSSGAG